MLGRTAFVLMVGLALVSADSRAACPETLDFLKRRLDSDETVRLCEAYSGKVVLVVNTASRCGFTPQLEGLEALYETYRERGLVVLGFPSNDFGGQEPGSESEIKRFCRLTYGVRFPMFEKTHAAKERADPLYRALAERAGEYPSWNFHKYLLDRSGRIAGSFPSRTRPDDAALVSAIEALL